MDTLFWLAGILVVFFIVTELIKRFVPNAQGWLVISMVRFTKPLKIFDTFRKHPHLVNWLTDIGLVIGFGSLAVDYLWGRTQPTWKRIIAFLVSMIVLGSMSTIVFPVDNPIIPIPPIVIQVSFGLFGFAGAILVSLFYSGLDIFNKLSVGKNACAGVAPVIPGVDLPNSPVSVPIHAWLSFLIILIVHEASHGFVVRKIGMKIKSYGLLLLGFLPIGAFVEPDENALQKLEHTNPREALRMYAAGPSSNFYFFALGTLAVVLFSVFAAGPFLQSTIQPIHDQSVIGVHVSGVDEKIIICGSEFEAPAHGVLLAGDSLLEVDGNSIDGLSSYVTNISGKESYTLTIGRGEETFTHSFSPNELGRIGITVEETPNPDYTAPDWYDPFLGIAGFVASFVGWLLLLNFLVAVANFIPIDPFDGGKMVKLILFPYLGILGMGEADTKKFIGRVFMAILLVLIIVNALPLFIV